MEAIVTKTFRLNLLQITAKKRKLIDDLLSAYREAMQLVISHKRNEKAFALQRLLYGTVRHLGLPSMMACYLFSDARSRLLNGGEVGDVTLPFNIPRSGNLSNTERGNPVVSLRVLNERIAIPVAKDGAYTRFLSATVNGWQAKAFRLDGNKIFMTIRKSFPIETTESRYDSILGVDVGVKRLATISIISRTGEVLDQLYFGQDVGDAQRNTSIRRSKLVSYRKYGSRYARQALRRLRRSESHFTKTRCEQIAHQIVELADRCNSIIAIEDLTNLNHALGNRKGNRKSKRLPYRRFRAVLEALAILHGKLVVTVSPRGTSRMCSRCGSLGIRNRSLFQCEKCGYLANADRNASVNIARRAAIQRPNFCQISARNLSVMAGVLVHARGK